MPAKTQASERKAMAIEAKYASAQTAKANGFFSRRHKTSEAHDLNKATRSFKTKKLMRQEEARQRVAACAARTLQQQVAVLDQRLGVGQGAIKERERLFVASR